MSQVDQRLVIGIDLGGTKIAGALVSEHGDILERTTTSTPAQLGPEAVLGAVVTLSQGLMAAVPRQQVRGLGIGAAGVIHPLDGSVVSATNTLPGWTGTPLQAELQDRLGVPVRAVNDVHAAAMGEAWRGAAAGHRDVLMIMAGTGIGGAVIANGELVTGAHGLAGHVGHLAVTEGGALPCTCGSIGHLESVAAGPAILAAYRRAGHRDATSMPELAARADAGDEAARDIVSHAAHALGRAIGGLINCLDPEAIVIAGGLADAGDVWWASVREGVSVERIALASDCPLTRSSLAQDAGVLGAARVIMKEVART